MKSNIKSKLKLLKKWIFLVVAISTIYLTINHFFLSKKERFSSLPIESIKEDSLVTVETISLQLNKGDISKEIAFSKLISLGDNAFNEGENKEAYKAYQNASNIYKELSNKKKMHATYKLANALFRNSAIKEANKVLDIYLPTIKKQEFKEIELIRIFLLMSEINAPIIDYEDGFSGLKNPLEILRNIDLNNLKDPDVRKIAQSNIYFFEARTLYYSLTGDLADVISYNSDEFVKTVTLPTLREVKKKLELSLDLISNYNYSDPLTPLIYLWLGRIYGELGEIKLAEKYNAIGIEKTVSRYGLNHDKSIEAYSLRYALYRHIDGQKALQAALMANNISKNVFKSIKHRLFTYQILADAYINIGDIRSAQRSIDESILKFNSLEDISDTDIGIMYNSVREISTYAYLEPNYYNKLENYAYKFEKMFTDLFPQHTVLPMNEITITPSSEQKKLKKLLKESDRLLHKYHEADDRKEHVFDNTGHNQFLNVAEKCMEIVGCNTKEYIDRLNKRRTTNEFERNYSINKLIYDLRLMALYLDLGLLKEYKELEINVDIIHDNSYFSGELHTAVKVFLHAKYLYLTRKHSEFVILYTSAYIHITNVFGTGSDMLKQLNSFNDEIKNKVN